MPAIRDLDGLWQSLGGRFAIAAATVTSDDFNPPFDDRAICSSRIG
jgi:hypothetical protein